MNHGTAGAIGAPKREFDLTELSDWDFKNSLRARKVIAVVGIVFTVMWTFLIIVILTSHPIPFNTLAFVLVGLVAVLSIIGMGLYRSHRSPVLARLGDEGIMFRHQNGKTSVYSWDDGVKRLTLQDWGGFERSWVTFPYRFTVALPFPSPAVAITPELFETILSEAKNRSINVITDSHSQVKAPLLTEYHFAPP